MTLLDLIQKSRASETGVVRHCFVGTDKWLEVDTRKLAKHVYIFGSGFAEVDHLTRKGAANVMKHNA